jgi:hypothetical protein
MTRLAQVVRVSSVLLEIGNGSPHMTDMDIEAIDYFRDEAVARNPFPYLDSLVRDQPVWIEPRYAQRIGKEIQAGGLGSRARPSDRS